MAVWDLATGALIETIGIDFPQSAAINPKTNRLYVADNFSSQVVVVDGVTNAVIDGIQTGQAYFPDGCYVPGPCITQSSSPWGLSLCSLTPIKVPPPGGAVIIRWRHPNRSGNTGTITRFGSRAQNQSLLMFAGEA